MITNDVPNGAARNPDQLTGWKEIATYLDKAVRTVQRWEPELGMPIHRIGIRGNETIFAFKTELDAWRAHVEAQHWSEMGDWRETANGSADSDRDSANPANYAGGSRLETANDSKKTHRGLARKAIWTLLAVLGITAVVAYRMGWLPGFGAAGDRIPAQWNVDDGRFHVLNAAGVELWSKTFLQKLQPRSYLVSEDFLEQPPVQIRDIDGDGKAEVLVVPWLDSPDSSTTLHCYTSDGVEKWTRQVSRTVNYGSHGSVLPLRPHHPPFQFSRMWILDGGARTPEVWATARHNHEFPAVLQRFDPSSGRPLQEYWSAGDVWMLTSDKIYGRRYYFVGGVKNEGRQAMLAVFDAGGPSGVAPADDPYYACQDCGTARPLVTLAFPRSDVAMYYGTFPVVESVAVRGNDVWVAVRQNVGHEHDDGSPFLLALISYRFDSHFRLLEANHEIGYESAHQRLERTGAFDHPFDQRSHERELWPVNRWAEERWSPISGPETPTK